MRMYDRSDGDWDVVIVDECGATSGMRDVNNSRGPGCGETFSASAQADR